MKHTIRSVLIIANTGKADARDLSSAMEAYFHGAGIHADSFHYEGVAHDIPIDRQYDLAITLGGDGTVLFASRVLAAHQVPILPVNLGDFGFISEVGHSEWQEAFQSYVAGEIVAGNRFVIQVCVYRDGREFCRFRGLNDAVVSSEGISRMVRLSVSLGKQHLGTYKADGVMVATPTGSTAYSAAAGGPILHPEMDAMILNPICPFTLSHRPIVLPPNEEVRISVDQAQRTSVALTVDGQSLTPLIAGDYVIVRASGERAQIIRSDQRNFYEVLRTKLNWSGGPYD
ncbi:MAG: NAD(+)/NADH kinase [Alkalispirochaeta sp.]